jgi:hypothetical protein
MIVDFLKSIGVYPINDSLNQDKPENIVYDLDQNSDSEKITLHRDFLKSALEEENNRLGFIENKTSQIISQTSIVFSLVGLFIPLLINRFENENLLLRIIIIGLLVVTFILYLLSITNALKNFNVKKFRYPYSNSRNVTNLKDNTKEEFNSELVRDYLFCIDETTRLNNIKGTNLLHAYKTFKLGIYFTGVIVICICSMLLFTEQKTEKSYLTIEEPIEIKHLDSLLNKNKSILIIKEEDKKTDTINKNK